MRCSFKAAKPLSQGRHHSHLPHSSQQLWMSTYWQNYIGMWTSQWTSLIKAGVTPHQSLALRKSWNTQENKEHVCIVWRKMFHVSVYEWCMNHRCSLCQWIYGCSSRFPSSRRYSRIQTGQLSCLHKCRLPLPNRKPAAFRVVGMADAPRIPYWSPLFLQNCSCKARNATIFLTCAPKRNYICQTISVHGSVELGTVTVSYQFFTTRCNMESRTQSESQFCLPGWASISAASTLTLRIGCGSKPCSQKVNVVIQIWWCSLVVTLHSKMFDF